MVDIGSGLGGFTLHLAAARPESVVVGIELAPLPWLVSRLRAAWSGSRARFLRGDYEQLNFAEYDLVFAYLSPAAMPALWRKAQREMRPGSLLASYEFEIPAADGVKTIRTTEGGQLLYIRAF
jgi:predicted O-methyltransferase YrrM